MSTPSQSPPPPTVEFDSNPQTLILYADIHYPGIPRPTRTPNDRYCAFLPTLRVWGDGYAFLDENGRNEIAAILSGQLDRPRVQTLLDLLNAEGFFTTWQAPGPNPAGTWLKIGAQLKSRPVIEYISGQLQPLVYDRLIEVVRVKLKPAAEQNRIDPRVEEILKENENCNKYMYPAQQPATPATASAVATMRPSPQPPSTPQANEMPVGPTGTPTSKPDEVRTPPPPVPTFTPFPVTEVTHLAPELAAEDKATAFVRHTDGTYLKILFRYNTDPKNFPIRPDDVLVLVVPPASIVGRYALTPFAPTPSVTLGRQPYPGPSTRTP